MSRRYEPFFPTFEPTGDVAFQLRAFSSRNKIRSHFHRTEVSLKTNSSRDSLDLRSDKDTTLPVGYSQAFRWLKLSQLETIVGGGWGWKVVNCG